VESLDLAIETSAATASKPSVLSGSTRSGVLYGTKNDGTEYRESRFRDQQFCSVIDSPPLTWIEGFETSDSPQD
jgi:hypothetical protein